MKTCTPPPSPRVPMGLALAVAFGLGCAGLKAAPTADHLAPDVRGCVEAPSRGCIEALRAASRRDDRAGVAQTLMAMAPRSEAEDILRAFSLLVLKRPVLPPHTTIEDLDASRKTLEAFDTSGPILRIPEPPNEGEPGVPTRRLAVTFADADMPGAEVAIHMAAALSKDGVQVGPPSNRAWAAAPLLFARTRIPLRASLEDATGLAALTAIDRQLRNQDWQPAFSTWLRAQQLELKDCALTTVLQERPHLVHPFLGWMRLPGERQVAPCSGSSQAEALERISDALLAQARNPASAPASGVLPSPELQAVEALRGIRSQADVDRSAAEALLDLGSTPDGAVSALWLWERALERARSVSSVTRLRIDRLCPEYAEALEYLSAAGPPTDDAPQWFARLIRGASRARAFCLDGTALDRALHHLLDQAEATDPGAPGRISSAMVRSRLTAALFEFDLAAMQAVEPLAQAIIERAGSAIDATPIARTAASGAHAALALAHLADLEERTRAGLQVLDGLDGSEPGAEAVRWLRVVHAGVRAGWRSLRGQTVDEELSKHLGQLTKEDLELLEAWFETELAPAWIDALRDLGPVITLTFAPNEARLREARSVLSASREPAGRGLPRVLLAVLRAGTDVALARVERAYGERATAIERTRSAAQRLDSAISFYLEEHSIADTPWMLLRAVGPLSETAARQFLLAMPDPEAWKRLAEALHGHFRSKLPDALEAAIDDLNDGSGLLLAAAHALDGLTEVGWHRPWTDPERAFRAVTTRWRENEAQYPLPARITVRGAAAAWAQSTTPNLEAAKLPTLDLTDAEPGLRLAAHIFERPSWAGSAPRIQRERMARALDEALPAWTMVQMLPAAALLARRVGDAAVARQAIERYTREIDAGRARAGTVQCNLMSQLGHTLYTGQFAGPTYQGLTTFQAPIGGTSSLQIGLGASSFSRIGADTECVLRADRDITREAVQVWLGEAVFRMVNEDAAGGTRFLNRAIEGLHRLEHAFPGWSPDHAALAGGREDLDLRYLALAASAASQASHPFAGAELSRLSRQLGSPQSELPDSIPAAFDPFEAAHTLWSRVEEASKVAEMLQGRSEPSSSFASEGPFRETARLFRNLACDPRNLRGARRALSEERPFEAVSWALSALRRCGPDEDPGFEALLQEASSEAPPWIRALIWKHFGSPRGGSWLAWAEAVRGRAPPMLQTMVHLRALWERMKTPEPIWPVTRPLLEGLSGMGQIDRGERWWLEWTARTLDGTSLDDLKSSLDAFGPPKALAKATAGTEEALRSAMRTWTESRLRSLVQASQGGD